MKAIEELRQEHEGIKVMLKILQAMCERLEFGKDVDISHLKMVLEFFRVFADRCHHGKEEDILFPALEAAGVPRQRGPLGVMLAEHDLGRSHLREMTTELDGLETGNGKNVAGLCAHARSYISLLTDHIEKENTLLFPMAEAHIPPSKQDELFDEFEKLESDRIGAGVHEKFHAVLRQFAAEYLK
jgi:hemerythrin-like domain-containing protein